MAKKSLQWIAFPTLLMQLSFPVLAANPSAWMKPQWDFSRISEKQKRPIGRSLVFDQHFDKQSLRPLPVFHSRSPASDAAPVQIQFAPTETRVALNSDEPVRFELPRPQVEALVFPSAPALVPTPVNVPAPEAQPPTATPPPAPAPAPTPAAITTASAPKPNNSALPTISLALTPTPPPAPVVPQPAAQPTPPPAPTPIDVAFVPSASADAATVYVMSEESLMAGTPKGVEGAIIKWVGPQSGLLSKTNKHGVATAPYAHSLSLRFLVEAPGYLPAVGYALNERLTPVVLIAEARLPAIIKSLGLTLDPQRRLVLGKLLDEKLKPVSDVTVDATVADPFRSYYSLGAFGLYHPQAKRTGPQGDFLVSGVADGLQYLMPTQSERVDWAPGVLDTSELPTVLTFTMQESKSVSARTQVVDALSVEVPDTLVSAVVGGSRGVYTPDEHGYLKFEKLGRRALVDLVEINATGYLKTWFSMSGHKSTLPANLMLFNDNAISEIFGSQRNLIDVHKGLVFGQLMPERWKKSVELRVYGPSGVRKKDARIFYFDASNQPRLDLRGTEASDGYFAISGLESGEWHVLLLDSETGRGLGAQLVRVEAGGVAVMQF